MWGVWWWWWWCWWEKAIKIITEWKENSGRQPSSVRWISPVRACSPTAASAVSSTEPDWISSLLRHSCLNHTEAATSSNLIWWRPHFSIHMTVDDQVEWHGSPSSGSRWTLQPGNHFSHIFILPIWNVSFLLFLHYPFLNPFSLSHSFIHSFLLRYFPLTTLLSLLVLPLFSNNHSSTLHAVLFSYPPAKVHFDFFLPKSFYAPFSLCTFITPYSLPIPPFSITSSLASVPSSICPILPPFSQRHVLFIHPSPSNFLLTSSYFSLTCPLKPLFVWFIFTPYYPSILLYWLVIDAYTHTVWLSV